MADNTETPEQISACPHTPAPWSVVKSAARIGDDALDFTILANVDTTRIIAETYGRVGKDIFVNARANANLIAAAPQLLNDLRAIVQTIRNGEFILAENPDHSLGVLAAQSWRLVREAELAIALAEGRMA